MRLPIIGRLHHREMRGVGAEAQAYDYCEPLSRGLSQYHSHGCNLAVAKLEIFA